MALVRGVLYRQRWIISGVILLSALIALIVTLLATPIYEARSTVRVLPNGTQILEGQNIGPGIHANQVYDMLATHVEVIRSRSLAQSVAADLNLGERYVLLGQDVDQSRPANISDEEWSAQKQSMAVDILVDGLATEVPQENWIISIGYQSDNPALAAEIANAYSRAFVLSDNQTNLTSNEYAQQHLTDQIERLRTQLAEAEQTANGYARANGIIVQRTAQDDDPNGQVTLTNSNLTDINARASAARAVRIEREQRWRAVRNLPAGQLPEVQDNPVLQGLISDRIAKRSELANLQQRYTDDFPEVRNLLAEVQSLDAQIVRVSNDIKASVRNDYQIALQQEQALQNELSSLAAASLAEQDRQVEYNALQREAEALRYQLRLLLERYNEISTAANVQSGKITALDAASVPSAPIAPSLYKNMALALMIGVVFAGGIAVLRETFDDKIRALDDIEKHIDLPQLGHTPFVKSGDKITAENENFAALMESYASIRSALDFNLSHESNVIQLTSTMDSEGKSTTAVILAELFARSGQKVLLIDGDLRRPAIASLLNLETPESGLAEILEGNADLESAVIAGQNPNLDILAAGAMPDEPPELLSSGDFQALIEQCRKKYALVLIDTSPVLGLADAPVVSRVVDGTIFVVEANRIGKSEARTAIRRLRAAGGKMLGAVMTKYRALEAGQPHSYQYAYYRYGSGDKTYR